MGRATTDFAEAAHGLATYVPPDLPDVVRELVGPPNYGSSARRPSRFRFLLPGVAIDIVRPSEGLPPAQNTITFQMSRLSEGGTFPIGPLREKVFDSDFWLVDDEVRLIEARSELFDDTLHRGILVEAGLGELVVEGFRVEFEPYAQYTRDVDSRLVKEVVPQLPNQLIEMATQL